MRKPVFEASDLVQYNFGFREAREEEGLYYLCSENTAQLICCCLRNYKSRFSHDAAHIIVQATVYRSCTLRMFGDDALPWRNCCVCTALEGGPFMQNVIPHFQGDSTCNLALKGQAVSKKRH